jgi:hypothetical protein
LAGVGLSEADLRAVHRVIQRLFVSRDFPVRPSDKLSALGIGTSFGVGIDDLIEDLTSELGIKEWEGKNGRRMYTVEDLARYLAELRRE